MKYWITAAFVPLALATLASAQQPVMNEGKPVAMFATRASLVPRAEDLEVLKSGKSLYLSTMKGGMMTIVAYAVQDGKIGYRVTSGAISSSDHKAIDKAVTKMQKKLAG